MDNRFLFVVIIGGMGIAAVLLGLLTAGSPEIIVSVLMTLIVSLTAFILVVRNEDDRRFVMILWLVALALRFAIAGTIYGADLRANIAPDWETYDFFGNALLETWQGLKQTGAEWLLDSAVTYRSGWGMYYYVAAVYYVVGRNPLAIQLLSCVFGASSCVLIYRISQMVVPVQRVARLSAWLCAISPSMLIWTSQGVKEPLILFLLCTALYLTLRLARQMTFHEPVLLLLTLFGIYSLRHYVFYVVFLAAGAGLVVASRQISPQRILQGSLAVMLIGLFFAYYGAGDVAEKSLDLKLIQSGREWSAGESASGYGGDVDITDTRAALAYLPLGTLFFLFAPFPWMIRNFNHLVILPEMIAWWLSIPFLVRGFWIALRYRLSSSLSILMFTVGLTLSYALYLTNFGTAYRMRVQVLGFFIIFVSIGYEAWQRNRERTQERRRHYRLDQAGIQPRPVAHGLSRNQLGHRLQ